MFIFFGKPLFFALFIRFQTFFFTKRLKRAFFAFRIARRAKIAAEKDEIVMRLVPAVPVDLSLQLFLHLLHAVAKLRQAKPLAHPIHMGIHREAWNVERDAAHDIGRLSSHTCQRLQFFIRARHDAVKTRHQIPGHRNDVFRLRTIQSNRADVRFDIRRLGFGEALRVRIRFKQLRRHFVDGSVRCLRRQNHRHDQLKRRVVEKLALRVRKNRFDFFDDFIARHYRIPLSISSVLSPLLLQEMSTFSMYVKLRLL